MYLFFDTETTGLYDKNLPPAHRDQPYIVQLAAALFDENARLLGAMSTIVFNPGIEIPEKAAAVHGITTGLAYQFGVRVEAALDWFLLLYDHAKLGIAHNAPFDKAVLETAIARRYSKSFYSLRLPVFCTMAAATDVTRIAPTPKMVAAGFGDKFKAPKLEECIRYLFNEEMPGAHDALVDVMACARVFFLLKEKGLVPNGG